MDGTNLDAYDSAPEMLQKLDKSEDRIQMMDEGLAQEEGSRGEVGTIG
jgi:hypothetical protein